MLEYDGAPNFEDVSKEFKQIKKSNWTFNIANKWDDRDLCSYGKVAS